MTEAEISEAAADKAAVAAEAQGCLEEQVQQAADEAAAAAIAKARAKSSTASRIITGWQRAAGKPRPVTQERCDAFVKILRGESGHSTTTSYKHDAFSLMYVNVKPRGSNMPAPRDFKPGGRGYDITCICKAYTHSFCCRHSLAVASAIQCTLGKGASVGPPPYEQIESTYLRIITDYFNNNTKSLTHVKAEERGAQEHFDFWSTAAICHHSLCQL